MEREGTLPILVAYMDSSSHPLLADVVEEAGYKPVFASNSVRLMERLAESDYALVIAEILEPYHPRCMSWPVINILQRFASHIPAIAISPDKSHLAVPPFVATADLGDPSTLISHVRQHSRKSVGPAPADTLFLRFLRSLWARDDDAVLQLVQDEVRKGSSVGDIYESLFTKALHEVGDWWGTGSCLIAEEHALSELIERLMSQVMLNAPRAKPNGRKAIVICAPDEEHELSARMVADLLGLNGWSTMFCGANTPATDVAQLAFQENPDLVCISCTMPVGQLILAQLVRSIKETGDIPVIIGGQAFENTGGKIVAAKVGADDYARTVVEAVELANRLVPPHQASKAA